MIDKAKTFAARVHFGQVRKGTTIPYIVHPIAVGEIVATMTDDEEVIAAAILHDTLEDGEGVTVEILSETFSPRVAQLVRAESEDKSKTWHERKSATICRLKTAKRDVKCIALGDKLSNIRDINRDYDALGDEVWMRFRVKDKEKIGWYYRGVLESLRDLEGLPAYGKYEKLVKKVFGEREEERCQSPL